VQNVIILILQGLLAINVKIQEESYETLLCYVSSGCKFTLRSLFESSAAVIEDTLSKKSGSVHG
jgi:hypothetical protein